MTHREIEGRVYVGEVKEKEKAKEQYEKAVSSGQTAGLIKYIGMKMSPNVIRLSVAPSTPIV